MLFERIGFDDQEYIALLDKLIRHSKQVQNNPEAGLVPKESLIADEIKTYLGELPGLSITSYAYDKNNTRSNLIIRYKNSSQITNKQILFMGSHLDVVPADPKEWLSREPFKLIVEHTADDILLHGRGTTDCLGHVALLSMMIKKLAQKEVRLAHEIILVFIADEEVGSANVGVFRLYEDGLLDEFKQAPIYWVDTATDDGLFGPRVGTGGVGRWSVTITGKSGHSGYPQHCINPISVAVELINYINERFKLDFQNEEAQAYAKAHLYPSCSTCKCTGIISRSPGKNIIPGDCSFGGDVRFTPDFDAKRIKQALPGYVDAFNKKIIADDLRGPGVDGGAFMTLDSKNNKQYAQLNFFWDDERFNKPFAADMNSQAYNNILEAMKEVRGRVQPFSALGSLPLISELQEAGFSLIPIGFGLQKAYHAPNEYCCLSHMKDGYKVMLKVIDKFEQNILN